MELDPQIVQALTVRLELDKYLRVLSRRYAKTPLGMGHGQTRFASPDKSFQLIYAAGTLVTGIAETIIRDRFEEQSDRTLHASEVDDWAVSEIATTSPLVMVDLRGSALIRLGVTTDATRAKHQDAGRHLSQILYKRFAVDGILYASRLTGDDCLAIYDRAVRVKLKADKAVPVLSLAELVPTLTSLNITLV